MREAFAGIIICLRRIRNRIASLEAQFPLAPPRQPNQPQGYVPLRARWLAAVLVDILQPCARTQHRENLGACQRIMRNSIRLS